MNKFFPNDPEFEKKLGKENYVELFIRLNELKGLDKYSEDKCLKNLISNIKNKIISELTVDNKVIFSNLKKFFKNFFCTQYDIYLSSAKKLALNVNLVLPYLHDLDIEKLNEIWAKHLVDVLINYGLLSFLFKNIDKLWIKISPYLKKKLESNLSSVESFCERIGQFTENEEIIEFCSNLIENKIKNRSNLNRNISTETWINNETKSLEKNNPLDEVIIPEILPPDWWENDSQDPFPKDNLEEILDAEIYPLEPYLLLLKEQPKKDTTNLNKNSQISMKSNQATESIDYDKLNSLFRDIITDKEIEESLKKIFNDTPEDISEDDISRWLYFFVNFLFYNRGKIEYDKAYSSFIEYLKKHIKENDTVKKFINNDKIVYDEGFIKIHYLIFKKLKQSQQENS